MTGGHQEISLLFLFGSLDFVDETSYYYSENVAVGFSFIITPAETTFHLEKQSKTMFSIILW